MSNSFTVFPNVLPGNVTIGGNLTVSGDQVRIGAAAPFMRIGKDAASAGSVLFNVGFDQATLDSGAITGHQLQFNQGVNGILPKKYNTAAAQQAMALLTAIFTDNTQHVHTGDITKDSIVTKVIRGGLIGANGGISGRVQFFASTQGAGSSQIFADLGGNIANMSFSTAGQYEFEFHLANRNAQNSAILWGKLTNFTAGTVTGVVNTSANDLSVDQTLTIFLQNANNTDSQTVNHVLVTLDNSFGPV
jgi:hypothetical protein